MINIPFISIHKITQRSSYSKIELNRGMVSISKFSKSNLNWNMVCVLCCDVLILKAWPFVICITWPKCHSSRSLKYSNRKKKKQNKRTTSKRRKKWSKTHKTRNGIIQLEIENGANEFNFCDVYLFVGFWLNQFQIERAMDFLCIYVVDRHKHTITFCAICLCRICAIPSILAAVRCLAVRCFAIFVFDEWNFEFRRKLKITQTHNNNNSKPMLSIYDAIDRTKFSIVHPSIHSIVNNSSHMLSFNPIHWIKRGHKSCKSNEMKWNKIKFSQFSAFSVSW